jgi:hypothetical protein
MTGDDELADTVTRARSALASPTKGSVVRPRHQAALDTEISGPTTTGRGRHSRHPVAPPLVFIRRHARLPAAYSDPSARAPLHRGRSPESAYPQVGTRSSPVSRPLQRTRSPRLIGTPPRAIVCKFRDVRVQPIGRARTGRAWLDPRKLTNTPPHHTTNQLTHTGVVAE